MANISFIVKQKLESAIKILCRDFSSHVKRPGKDFSRNRKLPLNKIAARWPAKAVAQFYFY